MYPSEFAALQKMGKKLVAMHDLPAGHVLAVEDVGVKSPGDGLPPTRLDDLLGRPLLRGIRAEEDLLLEHVGVPHGVVST
jgi:sialic acid synthase SpsE